jgi:hypothetical protein
VNDNMWLAVRLRGWRGRRAERTLCAVAGLAESLQRARRAGLEVSSRGAQSARSEEVATDLALLATSKCGECGRRRKMLSNCSQQILSTLAIDIPICAERE